VQGPGDGMSEAETAPETDLNQPFAVGFAVGPTRGAAPLVVVAEARPSGGAAPWSVTWDWGDGGRGEEAQASHTYWRPGVYLVRGEARDAVGEVLRHVQEVEIGEPGPLRVEVMASPAMGLAPALVRLEARISGGSGRYLVDWESGDGLVITEAQTWRLEHLYRDAGAFMARAEVRDVLSGAQGSGQVLVQVADKDRPAVAVLATPAVGRAPLTVALRAQVLGGEAPFAYHWDFGDGGTQAGVMSPNRVFDKAGHYAVRLQVRGASGLTAEGTTAVEVLGTGSPVVELRVNAHEGVAPQDVRFTALVQWGSSPFVYAWDFDDGSPADVTRNPVHRYEAPGSYRCAVEVTGADGRSHSQAAWVVLDDAAQPIVSLSPGVSRGHAPLALNFQGGAARGVGPYRYAWDFGDGGVATQQNPSHTYQAPGVYRVHLQVTDSAGQVGEGVGIAQVVRADAPTVFAAAQPMTGRPPLDVRLSAEVRGGDAPVQCSWFLGDGGRGDGCEVNYRYQNAGRYLAVVTVSDDDGDWALDVVEIQVGD